MSLELYIGNTTLIRLHALTNSDTNEVITNATVTVTLYDPTGAEVSGQAWPTTMPHMSNGTYRATLDAGLSLNPNKTYTATIDATVSGVGAGHWDAPVAPMVRTD